MNPASYIPQSPRLLDQLREVLWCKHYSFRTEEAHVYWVNSFARSSSGERTPHTPTYYDRDMRCLRGWPAVLASTVQQHTRTIRGARRLHNQPLPRLETPT